MGWKSIKLATLTKLDIAAIYFAMYLSVACLLRGAVYDIEIAILLVFSLPILYLAFPHARSLHPVLLRSGLGALLCLTFVLCLQHWLSVTGSSTELWQQTETLLSENLSTVTIHDKAAWFQSLGRLLFFIATFAIALCVGSSESSSRVFIQAFLIAGTVCIAITFFVATARGVPYTTYRSYTHGFVNPNNASAYLGVMLLVALAQAVRFYRIPVKTLPKVFVEVLDKLSIPSIFQGGFLLFAVLLALAGLLMTGSRGGIVLTLFCAIFFIVMVLFKADLKAKTRKVILAISGLIMSVILIWSFTNFGAVITAKLNADGIDTNSRLTIYSAVMPMIRDHAWLGTGLGSFPDAFQPYRPRDISSDGIIDKAHNSYLEFAAEMGLPALLVLLTVLCHWGWLLYRGIKGRKERYTLPTLGLTLWLFAALYSLVDFPLQVPGIAAVFIALITVCVSQTDQRFYEPSQSATSSRKRVRIRKRRSKGAPKPI